MSGRHKAPRKGTTCGCPDHWPGHRARVLSLISAGSGQRSARVEPSDAVDIGDRTVDIRDRIMDIGDRNPVTFADRSHQLQPLVLPQLGQA